MPNLDNHTVVPSSFFGQIKLQEGRRLATFYTHQFDYHNAPAHEKSPMGGGGDPIGRFQPYEGWSNSATWCFNLYFMQESHLQDKLLRLRRQDGKINYDKAARLFLEAQARNWMEQIDDDSEGPVNVMEIVDSFLKDKPW